jgi:hypothetical protein
MVLAMTTTPWIPSHRPAQHSGQRRSTASTSRAFGGPERSTLLDRLDAEWAHLRISRRALRTARSWALPNPDHPLTEVVSDLTDLDQIRHATQRGNGPEHRDDAILAALIECSRVDELAGRIVLQHLLPALIVQARRHRSFRDRTDPIALIVPAAWLAIRSYDVERRPHFVASSLVSDAVFQAFRRSLRARSGTEEVCAPSAFAATPCHDGPATALDEFVTVLRDAQRAGVPTHELDLLRQLVRVGSPGIVAKQRNVTPRTVRNHRDRAIGHVRTALAVAAAA